MLDPIEFLARGDGLLFLIDPQPEFMTYDDGSGGHLSYFELLMQIVFEMRDALKNDKDLQHYVAIVFTKMDRPDHWHLRHDLDTLAEQVIGPEGLRAIESAFQPGHYEFFACSSIGVLNENQEELMSPNCTPFTNEQGVEDWRIRDPKKLQPYGVLEPFEWILEKLEKSNRSS
jgi:hypothetical protein